MFGKSRQKPFIEVDILGEAKMANPLQFIREARAELGKVVWPSRKDTIRVTIAVIVLSLAVAMFLGAVDYGLTKLFEWVVNNR
ncbi:MAG: preprotein translocase subunit SecE [Candidatus Doudnabacteria bacterium RIFCSPHIGHO2_01_FULL_45_18]|uniref:Protein translocase subunit SecE n=1 Tax=Candidatus Doudnabacteria bacterium RIFCSPHIGHO2_01_FULL_45_18 TaxID=1817823 RepID=A0A1F5NRA5_9BACT|nr:MAG: preprotein translocase subunit SecE [Candidatus Doudnabacteria bacterium RIFCSPHIGHO2_01_FULL_45_18]